MRNLYKFFIAVLLISCVNQERVLAQTDTSGISSLNPELLNIFNQKNPKKYKVAAVKVSGNKFFDQDLLVTLVGINVGDELSIPGGDNFSRAINKLWSQNYFSNVEIYITDLRDNQIYIEIVVTERPRLSKFNFVNAKKSESDDLKGKTGLVVGRVVTENMKMTAVEAIQHFYFEKGFRAVTVDVKTEPDDSSPNSESLNFIINKGRKVKINNIYFIGNTNISDSKLKKNMKGTKEMTRLTLFPQKDTGINGWTQPETYTFDEYLKDKGYLFPSKTKEVLDPYIRLKLLSSAKFDDKKYAEDKEKIISYYNSLGYRDAAIMKDTFYFNQKGDMNIALKVSEGRQYYFGNITWKGNTKYSDSLLTAILGIKKGDIYNAEILNKKLGKSGAAEGGDISGLYMDDGYLFFDATPIETSVYNDTIDYEIRMMEGAQAKYSHHITISGNNKTKDFVIIRELRTIPDEIFKRADIIRTQREIANLGFFNQESINPGIVPNREEGTVDVNWSLEEKSSDQLELSAGFGGGIGVTGTVGVSFNNFSTKNIFHKKAWDPLPTGDGQKLSLRVQSNGRAYVSESISFTEPWFGGKHNSFNVSLYNTRYSNAYDPYTNTYTKQKADSSYFKTTGISVGFAKQLKWPDDYFNLGFTLSYTRYKLKNYYIDYYNLPNFNNGFSNNLNFKVALQRNSVDVPIFPRRGSNYLFSLQLTPPFSLIDPNLVNKVNPYSWIEYHKWRFTGEWYVPLTKGYGKERNKQLVLKASAKFGYLGRYNDKLEVSPFERFQVGDAGLSNTYALLGYDIISHRGYPVYQTSDPSVNPDQQGASQYFTIFNKYTAELRYPLSLNPSSTIYGLTFFEAANGYYGMKDYNPFRLRRSVGVGMRFYLPMFGLLGFDYGVGLDRITAPGMKLKDAGRFTFMLGFEPE